MTSRTICATAGLCVLLGANTPLLRAQADRPPAAGEKARLEVTPLALGVVRVRQVTSDTPATSLNERVGFVRPGAARAAGLAGPSVRAASPEGSRLELLSPAGAVLATFAVQPGPGGGFALSATARPGEGWYGLGFHRKKIELHGLKMTWERRFRHDEATVPFFFSTAGYGVFSNNPWPQSFDFSEAEQWSLRAAKGPCDVFLIYGPSPREILDGYTRLCGRPELPPRWALDPLYICRYFEPQPGVEAIARTFRERDIPCGMIGLEPGWEEVPYRMSWRWHEQRFPSPRELIARLHAQGFRFEMWESGVAPATGFSDPAVRADWFRARMANSLDLGVDFFKQDDPYPRTIVSEELQPGVERKAVPLAAADAEAANIANSLYSETAIRQMEQHGGRRAMLIFNSYFASVAAHRWPTAWAADFPSGTGLINASLSGHGMVSRDMDARTPAGIHYGYLTPFSIVDSWAYYNEPWRHPPHVEAAHRFYAKLRMRLGPHLYSAARAAHESGLPMMRPMLLEHGDDPVARDLSSQHYLGDGLLVVQGARAYLPAGRWIDYWTGESCESPGAWRDCTWAEPAAGPLWVRSGTILVTKPVTAHAFAEDDSVLIAEIFPGDRPGRAQLYEDDGVSLAYREGHGRVTELTWRRTGNEAEVFLRRLSDTLSPAVARRGYLLKIHAQSVPAEVSWQGGLLREFGSYDELVRSEGHRGWCRDGRGPYVWVKPDARWQFTSDARGSGDPERDTARWSGEAREAEGRLRVRFGSEALTAARLEAAPPRAAEQLRVLLNPPERVALRDGRWLKMQTTVHAWLEAAGQPIAIDGTEVRLEVLDRDGRSLRTATQRATQGRVEFPGQDYVPGETTFRVQAPGLRPAEAQVGPTPAAQLIGFPR